MMGEANETDCVFKLRDKVKQLAAKCLIWLRLPPTLETGDKEVISR